MGVLMIGQVHRYFGVDNSNDLFNAAFVAKTKSGRIQFFRYLFVGGFSAVVNLALFYALYSVADLHYLFAELIAFAVATVVNYILSIRWVFESTGRLRLEFTLFTLVGAGGLGINELVLWICVSRFDFTKLIGEATAIAVVTVWSFALRRIVFSKLK